ncbi:MAG: YggS family pyridoxal phosphate-dependent enzyme [Spirochaetaceae bacterium]|jgi:pyridoxal phosphate enzyme (YggS family)|nr:YggS family pyridoxal phosphate-dependent enzyme [Spirochaetaceae bacterium]
MNIAGRIAQVEERIERACDRAGRRREDIRLMGVSKFQPREALEAAWDAGLRLFGESRVQEASVKFEGFRETRPGAELHLIGSLQRNKARAALRLFDVIQSADRDELIAELEKQAASRTSPLGVLLELNAGEETKSGYRDEDSLFRGAERLLAAGGLLPLGLMTMAPPAEPGSPAGESAVRGAFRALVHAQGELLKRFPEARWSYLSMGMSGDFEIAVEEGSTLLRIGTAIFGERRP